MGERRALAAGILRTVSEHGPFFHVALLGREKSTRSLHWKRSNSASTATPSDQKAKGGEERYWLLLETKGVNMGESELGSRMESKKSCKLLLEKSQPTLNDTLFQDDLLEASRDMQYASRHMGPAVESNR